LSKEVDRRSFLAMALASGVGTNRAAVHTAHENSPKHDEEVADTRHLPTRPASSDVFWWEQEPLRILDLETCWSYSDVASRPPAELTARKVSLAFDAEHLHVMGMAGGLDDQQLFFSSKVAGRQNEDYLRRYLPEAKKRGLRVFIYFNVHWYKPSFGNKHPDWLQTREDGGALNGVYRTGTSFCVNTPWREWCFQVVRDLCAYPIDGIFYDGPIFFPDTCYCRSCQERFQKIYGTKLPSKKEREGKPARELLEFQARSLTDFLHDSRAIIKAINPQIAFYMNGGERGGNWSTGRLNRVLIAEQDILGSEGGFLYGDLTRTPVWKPGVTARLLESQAAGKPRIIFSAGGHKPWTFSILPDAELRLLYAETVANAAGVWFGVSPFEFDQPEMKAIAQMNHFVSDHAAYYLGTRSEAAIAVVWSDTTANHYAGANAQLLEAERVPSRSEVGDLNGEFSGITDAVLRTQTPFDVVDDVTLEQEPLDRYAALFLPNVACMSEKTAGRLREYVRGGGQLFATFETSLYDETGIRRGDFALADVFGVSDTRRIVGPDRWDFMKPSATSLLLEGVTRDFIPSPVYHVRVKLRQGLALLYFTQPLAGTYDGVPGLSNEPAFVVNHFGKGQALYSSGDLGNAINTFHMVEFFRLIANVVRRIAPSPVVVENAPASLEVVLRSQQQGQRLLLHLINYTGEMTRPIERMVPLENVRLSVRTQSRVKQVRTLVHPQDLTPRVTAEGIVQFVLPRMEEYEVVILEK
jgi:putative glycosyl hydrolase-like family 6 (GHL6) protein/glycosyl hydrolase family 42 (putative beta-galactosidase)